MSTEEFDEEEFEVPPFNGDAHNVNEAASWFDAQLRERLDQLTGYEPQGIEYDLQEHCEKLLGKILERRSDSEQFNVDILNKIHNQNHNRDLIEARATDYSDSYNIDLSLMGETIAVLDYDTPDGCSCGVTYKAYESKNGFEALFAIAPLAIKDTLKRSEENTSVSIEASSPSADFQKNTGLTTRVEGEVSPPAPEAKGMLNSIKKLFGGGPKKTC